MKILTQKDIDRYNYAKDVYKDVSHYDTAMNILTDYFTDNYEDLCLLVNNIMEFEDNKSINEAWQQFAYV